MADVIPTRYHNQFEFRLISTPRGARTNIEVRLPVQRSFTGRRHFTGEEQGKRNMRQIVQSLSVLALGLMIALPLSAEETKPDAKPEVKTEAKPDAKPEAKPETKTEAKPEAKEAKKKKKANAVKSPVLNVLTLPKEITLTAEQQTKLDAVKTEFEGKLKELAKKQGEILTAEQKQARQAAMKSAKEAGKKGKEAKAEVDAAVKMTEEQKKQQEVVGAEIKEVQGKVREAINAFLTEEQKTHIKVPGKKKKAKATA